MTANTPSDRTLDERLRDRQLIERALTRAVRNALLEHKRAGNPIAELRDGRIVWIAPEDIEVSDPDPVSEGPD